MPRTEHSINDALAELPRATRRAWRESKSSHIRRHRTAKSYEWIEPNVSPVVVETEVFPAATAEAEASSRLGAQMRTTGREILSSVAVRLLDRLRKKYGDDLADDLASAVDLEMALYTGSNHQMLLDGRLPAERLAQGARLVQAFAADRTPFNCCFNPPS